MKTAKTAVLAIVLSTCTMGAAMAGGHVSVGIGIGVGVPIYGPRYYGPPYPYYPRYYTPYYPPTYYPAPAYYPVAPVVVSPPVVYQPQQQVYVEQPQPQQAGVQPQDNSPYWYYCSASNAYYPYVKSCASGWEQVTPRPSN